MAHTEKILIVDDKQMMRDSVGATLQRAGFAVVAAADGQAALKLLAKHEPAAVLTDLKMPEMDGLALLAELQGADDQLPVVLMTAYGSVHDAVAAMKKGAFDFIQKPFEGDQLVLVMRRAVEHRRLLIDQAQPREANQSNQPLPSGPALIGESEPMRRLTRQIEQIASSHSTVLIAGESGTGKEVVARALHANSPRRDRPMLCLNCAALSSNLLESELFGHEKGAFTGADQLRRGRFELADGGTLLLDEISEISPELQAKLLRVLQEGQFERVGSSTTMNVDVRVVATTNRDLAHSVAAGDFRQDLYYRLNVLPLALPPLRERADDVLRLAAHFFTRIARREGGEPRRLGQAAAAAFAAHVWPGNVRELQNICERASVLSPEPVIDASLIQPWLSASSPAAPGQAPSPPAAAATGAFIPGPALSHCPTPHAARVPPSRIPPSGSHPPYPTFDLQHPAPTHIPHPNPNPNFPRIRPLEEVERDEIVRTLGHFDGNRQRTAAALGIGVRTLGLKLKKWKEQQLIAQTT